MPTKRERGRMSNHVQTPDAIPRRAVERAKRAAQRANQHAVMRSLARWSLIALATPFLGLAVYLWEQHRNNQVISRTPMGVLLDLRPVESPQGFRPMVLLLNSSAGFVSLHDPLNLPVGTPLVKEARASGRWYVCDVPRTQCAWVAQGQAPAG